MESAARLVAERRGGRTVCVVALSAPPLTLRTIGPGEVTLVGTAAGPLGGDVLRLEVSVGPGAALRIGSVAASLAMPGPRGGPSSLDVAIDVAAGGVLDWRVQPLVVVAGCDHTATTRIDLAPGARLRWREVVRLGRWEEAAGSVRQRLVVDRDGPLVRNELALGPRWPAASSPAVLGDRRVVATALVVGAPAPFAAAWGDDGLVAAVHPLTGDATVWTIAGNRADRVTAAADAALDGVFGDTVRAGRTHPG